MVPLPMDHFGYRDGNLYAEDVPVSEIAERFGTPTYIYSAATLTEHVRRLQAAYAPIQPKICFAVKCCPNIGVLRTLAQAGCGMDVVSAGELYRALLAGVEPANIVFAGVGKTRPEIRFALGERAELLPQSGVASPSQRLGEGPIGCFNIESEQEFGAIATEAKAMGVIANAAVRINPGVKAGGHEYITTATEGSKFGLAPDQAEAMIRRFAGEPHVRLRGLHMHIGSAITEPELFVRAICRMLELIDRLAASGVRIDSLDIGGGFAADYQTGEAPSSQEFSKHIIPLLETRAHAGLRILIEPGRMIAANAGLLLTRVQYTKLTGGHKFLVCDAGMHTLLRPSLYEAFHFVWPTSVSPQHEPVRRAGALSLPGLERCDVVGPICESGDFLAKDRELPPVAPGELLGIFTAGAYGMSMASRYNSQPLPAEVLVSGNVVTQVRRRERLEDLVRDEL